MKEASAKPIDRGRGVARIVALRDALLAGDDRRARAVVEAAADDGLDGADLHRRLLAPALRAVGHGWARGEVSVADEHVASAVAERLLVDVHGRLCAERRPPVTGDVVIACVEGERHALGARMAADRLEAAGLRVAYLGPDVPLAALLHKVRLVDRPVVGLSVTLSANVPAADAAVAALAAEGVPVTCGGGAAAGVAGARTVGDDDDLVRIFCDMRPPGGPSAADALARAVAARGGARSGAAAEAAARARAEAEVARQEACRAGDLAVDRHHRRILEAAGDGVWLVDGDGVTSFVNPAMERLVGHGRDRLIGKHVLDVLGEAAPAVLVDRVERGATDPATYDVRVDRADGEKWVRVSAQPLTGPGGAREGAVAFVTDITDRVLAEQRLARAEASQQRFIEASHDMVWQARPDGVLTLVSGGVRAILGYDPEDLVGRSFASVVAPGREAADVDAFATAAAGEALRDHETQLVTRAGDVIDVVVNVIPEKDEAGHVTGVSATTSDVTERRAAERALADAETRFRHAFAYAPIGIALVDLDPEAGVTYREVNDQLARVIGIPRDELVGRSASTISDASGAATELAAVRDLLEGGHDRREFRMGYARPDGTAAAVAVSLSVVRDASGAVLYGVKQVQDVTEQKRLEDRLRHEADHDALTGLFNRRRFEQELASALSLARRHGDQTAVLVLDLDDFKLVNDTHGHQYGDRLIASVAHSIRGAVRETDVLARLGGDEFAVILPRIDLAGAQRVASKLVDAVRSGPVAPGAAPARTTVSVGIALSTAGGADELLAQADVAMYDAKNAGGNRHATYDPQAGHQARMARRLTAVDRVRMALDGDGFVLFSQPILDLRSGICRHEELLLRLTAPDGTLLPPSEFLPVAEETGLILDVDRWVLRHAIELAGQDARHGVARVLGVNLSALSLSQPELPDFIDAEFTARGADPSRLMFEITETAAIKNLSAARTFIDRLVAIGSSFALDDFGAGYGSFYNLKHLPVDHLKIDGEFIRNLTTDPDDQLIVQAIVTTAKGLGKRTVAEFVEDEETLALLRSWGVDYAQGYHVGRPKPVEAPAPAARAITAGTG